MRRITTTKATAADFERLPPETRAELVDGDILYEPAPTYRHQNVVAELMFALVGYSREHGGKALCAPIDVELGQHDIYQPDVIYITESRREIITEKRIVGAPDLVVEILSPATGYYDLQVKKPMYARSGVSEYWIVDPMLGTVEMFLNVDGEFADLVRLTGTETITSTLLPGLELHAGTLFA